MAGACGVNEVKVFHREGSSYSLSTVLGNLEGGCFSVDTSPKQPLFGFTTSKNSLYIYNESQWCLPSPKIYSFHFYCPLYTMIVIMMIEFMSNEGFLIANALFRKESIANGGKQLLKQQPHPWIKSVIADYHSITRSQEHPTDNSQILLLQFVLRNR